MSSTPHSLAFNTKRNSIGSAQLPLPSSLNAPATQRPLGGTPTSPPQSLPGPSSPRPLFGSSPQSPIISSFSVPHHPPHLHSTTHAIGVQPSAAFFRPSRPPQQPTTYSRSNSPSSLNGPQTTTEEQFQLAPIGGGYSTDDHHIAESIHAGTESVHEQQSMSLKRMKKSREPLLPAPPGVNPRPNGSGSFANAHPAASRLMRNSLDRVLTLGRGLSFDSMRKSTASRTPPIPNSSDRRQTFETKISDDESQSHYKGPSLDPQIRTSVLLSRPSPSPTPSHSPSFIPTPPTRRPPLSAVPVLDPDTSKPLRRWQAHPSRNRFFLNGHILTGGDTPWAFMASFTLVLGIAGTWFGTTAVWWWRNESPAVAAVGVYMALLTISTMLATAMTDPGILPRDLDPDPPYPARSPSDGDRAPMPRDLKVRTDVVRVKYCPTCKTYRPPRSSHCKMCDNCVDACDHHCQWVNNCVGRRNYTSFIALLVSATTTLILIIITSALHLFLLSHQAHVSFGHALRTSEGTGSAVAFCLSICVVWPVGALLSYHLRLLLLNVTTIEQIRNQAHKTLIPGPPPPNPFSHGSWRKNLLAVLCRPQGPSWLHASGVLTEDKREVNPALVAEHQERQRYLERHGYENGDGAHLVYGKSSGGNDDREETNED